MRKKIVMLIRIRHNCVDLIHKKTVLSLETSSEINFEFIKFINKKRYDSELPYQRPDLIEVMEIEIDLTTSTMFILVSI